MNVEDRVNGGAMDRNSGSGRGSRFRRRFDNVTSRNVGFEDMRI